MWPTPRATLTTSRSRDARPPSSTPCATVLRLGRRTRRWSCGKARPCLKTFRAKRGSPIPHGVFRLQVGLPRHARDVRQKGELPGLLHHGQRYLALVHHVLADLELFHL